MSSTTTRQEVEAFLADKRLAIVGVSRDSKEFANSLFREFRRVGYNVIPVNPNADVVEGERCYHRLQDIQPAVEAALLMTAPALNEQVARDCAAAGVKSVWFYGIGERSAENARAIAFCREQGLRVIPGYCPLMFLGDAAFYHKAHGWVMRLVGRGPN